MNVCLLIIIFLFGGKIKAEEEKYEENSGTIPQAILFSPPIPSGDDNDYYDEAPSDDVSKAWNSLFNETDDIPMVNQ